MRPAKAACSSESGAGTPRPGGTGTAATTRYPQGRPVTERQGDKTELIEKVIKITRVAKVVKGGRRFSFSALVVVGNGHGRVGVALGKANEVTEAIRKGIDRATKSMKPVVLYENRTIPHQAWGRFGSSKVFVLPGAPGRGIIASGAARAIMECAGISDISVKTVGSRNYHNVIKATLEALHNMRTYDDIAARRGVSVERLTEHLAG